MRMPLQTVTDSPHKNCHYCCFVKICFSNNTTNTLAKNRVVEKQVALNRNQLLCKPQEQFRNLYVVRSGILKAWDLEVEGKLRITNFYLPGEVLGFEAIFPQKYSFSVSAVSEASVCEITMTKLLGLFAAFPEWSTQILKLISQRLNTGDYVTRVGAEQKLAGFLLELVQRLHHQDDSIILPMSRQDIASYLGMAAETVTRLLTRWQRQKLIIINQKAIQLLNKPQLEQLVQGAISAHS